jgi:hypothetical protein
MAAMPDQNHASGPRPKVFIVHPWHNARASLYPHVMDGVEYVDAVIGTIRSVFESERFDVRLDESVFVPGLTLRENLERELTNADIVLAILDGLRPNVVYELGFAYGYGKQREHCEEDSLQIICLADINATVLVRNYYSDPMSVPTNRGDSVVPLNPPLNMSTAFSDNSDLLILRYDRLDLNGSLGEQLCRLIKKMQSQETKSTVLSEATMESTKETEISVGSVSTGSPEMNAKLWKLYAEGKFDEVVSIVAAPADHEQKKVLALSLMKLGMIFQAMQIWREMATGEQRGLPGAFYHLGICYYVLGQYEKAAYYLGLEQTDRARKWLERAKNKLAQPQPGQDTSTHPTGT